MDRGNALKKPGKAIVRARYKRKKASELRCTNQLTPYLMERRFQAISSSSSLPPLTPPRPPTPQPTLFKPLKCRKLCHVLFGVVALGTLPVATRSLFRTNEICCSGSPFGLISGLSNQTPLNKPSNRNLRAETSWSNEVACIYNAAV